MNIVEQIEIAEKENWRHESLVNAVKNSQDYEDITKQLQELKEKQNAMLPVSTAPNELFELKKQMVDELREGKTYERIIPKYKEKKEVNQTMVIEAIGGDFGLYQELSQITQKSLKDFAKTQAGLKNVLNNCIQVVSREVVGFDIDKGGDDRDF